jgi:hypothetical protein
MSDIVERLRAVPDLRSDVANAGICREAAAEIERLRARNAEHEARYDALEAKEEYHKRDAERLRARNRCMKAALTDVVKWAESLHYYSDEGTVLAPVFAQAKIALEDNNEQPRVEQDAHSDTTGWFKREPK